MYFLDFSLSLISCYMHGKNEEICSISCTTLHNVGSNKNIVHDMISFLQVGMHGEYKFIIANLFIPKLKLGSSSVLVMRIV